MRSLLFLLSLMCLIYSSCTFGSEWKTFKNSHGWGIQYPSNWVFSEDIDDPAHEIGAFDIHEPTNTENKFGCGVFFANFMFKKHWQKIDIKSFTLGEAASRPSSDKQKTDFSEGRDLKISNFSAYEVKAISKGNDKPVLFAKWIGIKNGGPFELWFFYPGGFEDKKCNSFYDKMLSSFVIDKKYHETLNE